MEYIEREAILNRLNKVHMDNRPFDAGVQFGVDHAISCIMEAPAADVAPVVHGRWEPIMDAYGDLEGWICACGRESKEMSKYCPNCGAKMDERLTDNSTDL